jgi:hypothetical protein
MYKKNSKTVHVLAMLFMIAAGVLWSVDTTELNLMKSGQTTPDNDKKITADSSDNMTFTDPNAGTHTLSDLTAGGTANAVTAASTFGTDNVLIKADGTSRGSQATGIVCDDSDNITGVAQITSDGAAIIQETATGGRMIVRSSDTSISTSDQLGILDYISQDSNTNANGIVARIIAKALGDYTDNNADTQLTFIVNTDSIAVTNEVMNLSGSGAVFNDGSESGQDFRYESELRDQKMELLLISE